MGETQGIDLYSFPTKNVVFFFTQPEPMVEPARHVEVTI